MSRHNAFILTRFIFLSVLFWINLLSLIFAFWNIGAVTSMSLSPPGATIFVVVNVLLTILAIAAAYVPVAFPGCNTARIQDELLWSAFMGVMQLASAIDVTVNGPPIYCKPGIVWKICASSTMLIPTAWLATTAQIAYFFTLLAVTGAHVDRIPGLSRMNIFEVPWFKADATPTLPKSELPNVTYTPAPEPAWARDRRTPCSSVHRTLSRADSTAHWYATSIAELEKQDPNAPPAEHRPAWARELPGRRGFDHPFGGPKPVPHLKQAPLSRTATVLQSRFSFESGTSHRASIDLAPQAGSHTPSRTSSLKVPQPVRPGNPMERAMASSASLPILRPSHSRQPSERVHIDEFPADVIDEDKPIPTNGTKDGWVNCVGGSVGGGSVLANAKGTTTGLPTPESSQSGHDDLDPAQEAKRKRDLELREKYPWLYKNCTYAELQEYKRIYGYDSINKIPLTPPHSPLPADREFRVVHINDFLEDWEKVKDDRPTKTPSFMERLTERLTIRGRK